MSIEVLISQDDLAIGAEFAKTELGDIITRTREALIKSASRQNEKQVLRGGLDVLIQSYFALSDKVSRLGVLSGESGRDRIIWNYSLSCASTASLNYLENKTGQEMMFEASVLQGLSPLDPGSLEALSQYSIMANSLRDLRGFLDNTGGSALFHAGLFLTSLERMAGAKARLECSDEGFEKDLRMISPVSKAVSFRMKKRLHDQKPKPNGVSIQLEGDKLPDSLPRYAPNNVKLENVVGNAEQAGTILDHVAALMHYHPQTKTNFLWMDGNGFPEGILMIGDAGVGKTYLAHAIMNSASALAKQHGYPLETVEINGKEIGSTYQNRSGIVLEHYLSMMRRGDKAYLVLMDEFDDLIPIGKGGTIGPDAKQRMNAFKRQTGNSGARGNILFIGITNHVSQEDDIPEIIQNRFSPIIIPGPRTPDEYGRIIRLGLETKEKMGLVDPGIPWGKVGSYLMEWKKRIDSYNTGDVSIGRGYKLITNELAAKTRHRLHTMIGKTINKAPSYHSSFYSQEFLRIDERSVYRAIDAGLTRLLEKASRADR